MQSNVNKKKLLIRQLASCSGFLYLTKQKPIKILWIYSGKFTGFSCLFDQFFMAQTKSIFMGSTYENTIKKATKILWKFAVKGPCNVNHMKMPWLISMAREFDLFWGFHSVQGEPMKYAMIFSSCTNSWHFNGMRYSCPPREKITSGNFRLLSPHIVVVGRLQLPLGIPLGQSKKRESAFRQLKRWCPTVSK